MDIAHPHHRNGYPLGAVQYTSQADGVIIVYDISMIFSELGGWIKFAQKHRR